MNIHFLLLVFSFVLFVVSAFPQVSPYWNKLVSAGLACWIASIIF